MTAGVKPPVSPSLFLFTSKFSFLNGFLQTSVLLFLVFEKYSRIFAKQKQQKQCTRKRRMCE